MQRSGTSPGHNQTISEQKIEDKAGSISTP